MQGRVKSVESKAAKFDKGIVLYVLIFSLVITLNALWHFIDSFNNPLKFLLSFAISLFLGFVHLKLMYKKIEWAQEETFLKEFLLTTGIAILAMALSVLITEFFIIQSYYWVALLHSISFTAFLLPFLLFKTYINAICIPQKEYTYWIFPNFVDPPTEEWNKSGFVKADLIFTKSLNDSKVTTATVKVPLNAKFGDFISAFVENYNEITNPEYPVADLNHSKGNLRWQFVVRTAFGYRQIDPDKTVQENGIDKLVKKRRGENIYPNIYLNRVLTE
jgi:hypothetical protein